MNLAIGDRYQISDKAYIGKFFEVKEIDGNLYQVRDEQRITRLVSQSMLDFYGKRISVISRARPIETVQTFRCDLCESWLTTTATEARSYGWNIGERECFCPKCESKI